MGRTRTLADLVADIRWISDSEGQDDVTGRHTRAAIVRAANQALQELMLLSADAGEKNWVKTGQTTLTAGSQSVSLATDFPDAIRVYSVIAARGTTSQFWPLRAASWEEMQQVRTTDNTGPPEMWTVVRVPSSPVGHELAIYPLANASYRILLEYLPRAGTLEDDDDTIDGIAGYEDFVVYDAACRLAIRDANSDGRLALLQAERDRYAARIRKHNERGEVHAKVADQRLNRNWVAQRRGTGWG